MEKQEKPILVTRSSMPSFEEFTEMIRPIWDSAWLTNMGEYHQELERQLKEYMKTDNLVLFVNGHMALEMVIQADGTDRRGDHYPIYLCLYHPRDREKWLNAGVL